MQSSVINHSACASRRIEVVVSVSHDDDIEEAEAVIREVIAQQPFYAFTPEASVGVNTRGDFGQNILVQFWVQTDYVISKKMQKKCEVKRAVDKQKITIPFPRHEVELLST